MKSEHAATYAPWRTDTPRILPPVTLVKPKTLNDTETHQHTPAGDNIFTTTSTSTRIRLNLSGGRDIFKGGLSLSSRARTKTTQPNESKRKTGESGGGREDEGLRPSSLIKEAILDLRGKIFLIQNTISA